MSLASNRLAKNTIRYQEELGEVGYSNRDIAVGTLYVQKGALGEPVPQRLRVIIEEDADDAEV